MGHRAIGHVLLGLAIASSGCGLLVGIESRSEKQADADDAAVADVAVPDAGGNVDMTCAVGLVRCGTDCINLDTSNNHCGWCGHSCLGALCSRGECEAEKLSENAAGQVAAVDATEVFYRKSPDETAVADLIARNKTTGAERKLTQIGRWHQSVIDGAYLIILENAPKPRIRAVHRATGESQTLHEDGAALPFVDLVVSGDDIYWTTRGDLRHVNRDGTGFKILKADPKGMSKLAVSSSEILYSLADSNEVLAIPRSGTGDPVVRATGTGTISSITLLDDRLVFSSGKVLNVLLQSKPSEVTTFDLKFRTVHTTALNEPVIYFYDVIFANGSGSRILRFDAKTNEQRVIISNIRDGRLVVDDKHVYFSNYLGGLYRVAR